MFVWKKTLLTVRCSESMETQHIVRLHIVSIPDLSEGESGAEYGKTPAYNPNAAP